MPLRGKKPNEIEKRLKLFFYGPPKVGKTTLACQFPNPYMIDTERGAENVKYTKLLAASNGCLFQSMDFDEIYKEVLTLMTEKHDYKTVIIDPITTLYDDLIVEETKKLERQGKGNAYGLPYQLAAKKMKQLAWLLLRGDMNVVITAHAKKEYGDNMAVLGNTFDGWKKLPYMFDLILEGDKRGDRRVAIVKGSRLENFHEGDTLEFSYSEFKKRYDAELLEKNTDSIPLITEEDAHKLKDLIKLLHVEETVVDKWLNKAQASRIEELDQKIASKIITSLEEKINASV